MKGDSIPSYDLINWQRLPNGDIDFIKVGIYDGSMDAGKELVIQDERIKWPGNQSKASDRREFPTFFRVIPSDAYQVKAIAQLLIHFNWTWVGVVRGDHAYGRSALQGLLNELEDTSVCVSYQEMIPLLYDSQRAIEIIRVMNSSSARVVVVFSAEGELTPFLKDYMKLNVTGIQWIASEAWVTASVFTGSEYYPFLGGTIGFGIRQGYIPKLKDYITTVNPQSYPSNPLVEELWAALYGCSPISSLTHSIQLPLCTGQETLNKQHSAYMNTSSPRIAYNVYKGEMVNFDMNGDSIPSYDLINWQKGTAGNIELVKVGMYDGAREAGSELVVYDTAITWAKDKSEASCSQNVVQYMRNQLLKFCRVKWRFDPRAFRWALTLKLAVEEINNSTELLPNHTLGYKMFDSCAYPLTAQRAALAVMNGPTEADRPMCSHASPMLAVIAESGSAESIVVSRILQHFRIPMISYFSSCACLSNRREFPTFFRVIPSDAYQVKAIAKLLIHFNWTWVGVVRGDHVYGHFALQGLLKELEGTNVCVSYQEMIPLLYNSQKAIEIIRIMNSSSARVVVVFSAEGELTPFMKDYIKLNVTGIQWIASEALATASVFTGSEYYPFLGGMIGFGIRQGNIPKLGDYINTVNPQTYSSSSLVQELWGALYGCSPFSSDRIQLPLCTGQETLNKQHSAYMNTSSPRIAYNIYKSVYAIAHSLHNLTSCKPGNGPFINSTCADNSNVYPWQLQYYLQEVSFTISGELVNFDMNGDSIPSYDLINWQKGTAGNIELVKVGMYDGSREAGNELVIYDMPVTWAGDKNSTYELFAGQGS
ncbi:hypothetical protein KOW79_003630 [Hemibagrus wyckioides]|uniref:Receptor ligand binding region domain-containing protein n=1 Tax=Hemibagrus wyckioides TaxID=337641 RepID=A0A9D3P5S1_9TELE|nr:hypothetical protein KOW79_003630 [Hemibagrus wyckioides]